MISLPAEITEQSIERSRAHAKVRRRRGGTTGVNPWRKHVSYSLGVHSSQVDEANAELKRHGVVGAAYGADGFLRASGKQAKRRAQKATGTFNRESYE